MMALKILLSGSLAFLSILPGYSQALPVGSWRDHLPYHQAIGLAAAGSLIWCATPYSLFSVDPSGNSLDRLSKTNGLSETGISALQIDSLAGKLIIAYTNSNIDIVSGQHIFNIPDLRQAVLTGDRTIRQIFVYNHQAWLSTGLGLIVLDEDKYEIKDTYIIGSNGDTVGVQAVTTDGTFWYAATDEGLKQAPVNAPDLADYNSWSLLSGHDGLGAGPCRQVTVLAGQVLALTGDSLFELSNGHWDLFYTDGWTISQVTVSAGKLLVCERQTDTGRVLVLGGAGAVEKTLQQAGILRNPRQALFFENEIWVADSVYGLSSWGTAGPVSHIPNSPQSRATGGMDIGPDLSGSGSDPAGPNALWVASGGADSNSSPLNNRDGLYRLNAGGWTNYNASAYPVFDSVFDFVAVASSPRDSSVWAGSFGEGLLLWKPGDVFTVYSSNSPLGPVVGQPGVYRVSGLAFDPDGNLWVANYGAAKDLLVRKADGSWLSFTIPFPHTENAVSQVLVDNYKQIWIVSPRGNGVFCYHPGASLDNVSDDLWTYYRAGPGNGNLPDNNVFCLAKDKSGFIWIGTANGIGVIRCAQNIVNAGGCEAIWPVVQFDNFAGYLFSGQSVQTIAVDGADRKWIGTLNGAWLISPDAQKIIYHFTADSTPLLSNDVRKIVVDPQTGEVFFSTSKGICSFRGNATEGGSENSNVLVFPNPVPPGYAGTIAIRGLVDNAVVKITELNGRLVYQTNALGGQAVWNGRDYRGNQIAAGVYLVLVSDDARQEKVVTKIVFIGK